MVRHNILLPRLFPAFLLGTAAAVAVLATTSLASAADQVCEGWVRFGHESRNNIVFVWQPKPNNPDEADVKSWFDYRAPFGKRVLDRCLGEAGGSGADSWCRITGTLRPSRLGPQVVGVRSVSLIPSPDKETESNPSDVSKPKDPDDRTDGKNASVAPNKRATPRR